MRILGLSGRKNSGKNTLSNFLHGYQLRSNEIIKDFSIDVNGKLHVTYDDGGNNKSGLIDVQRQDPAFAIWAAQGMWPYVKNYAFGDALKNVAINLFEVPEKLAYGTNEDKNTIMKHLLWENMPGVICSETLNDSSLKASYEWGVTQLSDELSDIGLIIHEPGPMTIREFLQFLGSEIMRKIWGPVWVNTLMKQVKNEESVLSIITDVRFDNEAEAIINAGGKIIELTGGEIGDNHSSENGISTHLVSVVLDNKEQDLADTCTELLQIIEGFKWQE